MATIFDLVTAPSFPLIGKSIAKTDPRIWVKPCGLHKRNLALILNG